MDRDQCVVLNGCKSTWKMVLSGVPQWSILGPLLFTIYVNQSISRFMFADDTKLICSIQSIADHILFRADLDCLLKWCERWQLKKSWVWGLLYEWTSTNLSGSPQRFRSYV